MITSKNNKKNGLKSVYANVATGIFLIFGILSTGTLYASDINVKEGGSTDAVSIASGSKDAGGVSDSKTSSKKDDEKQRVRSDFVDRSRVNSFIDSLDQTSRDTGKNNRDTKAALRSILDIKLPIIDRDCDIVVSHELLRVGYAVRAEFPGAEEQLRQASEILFERTSKSLKGITNTCSAALRSFAVSILKVYLGSEWGDMDTKTKEEPRF